MNAAEWIADVLAKRSYARPSAKGSAPADCQIVDGYRPALVQAVSCLFLLAGADPFRHQATELSIILLIKRERQRPAISVR